MSWSGRANSSSVGPTPPVSSSNAVVAAGNQSFWANQQSVTQASAGPENGSANAVSVAAAAAAVAQVSSSSVTPVTQTSASASNVNNTTSAANLPPLTQQHHPEFWCTISYYELDMQVTRRAVGEEKKFFLGLRKTYGGR